MKEKKAYITFGAQIGDLKADDVVAPHLEELSKLLSKYCEGRYSPDVDEFAPIARVDGDIWCWNFEGCEKLRWSRIGRYITVDIGVPRTRWQGRSPSEIKKYLIDNLKQALILIVRRLKKEKAEIDDGRLFEDFAKVEKEFLS